MEHLIWYRVAALVVLTQTYIFTAWFLYYLGYCFVTFDDHKAPITGLQFTPNGTAVCHVYIDYCGII